MSKNLTGLALENGCKTAQDVGMFDKGFTRVDLPKALQHHSLSHYYLDNNLMVEIKKVRNIFYVHEDGKNDLKCLMGQANVSFLTYSKRKSWDGVKDFSIF